MPELHKEYFFVSDLHGHIKRYDALFNAIQSERPSALFLGGDLLPHAHFSRKSVDIAHRDFVNEYLVKNFLKLKKSLDSAYPRVFVILGNDDSKFEESSFLAASSSGIWEYLHFRHTQIDDYEVFGYANIPPSPFTLKDWEKYDVSRYVDPGCISPEEGYRTIPASLEEIRYSTIKQDLENLSGNTNLSRSIFLFHCPPYQSKLDRADLDGQMIDHVPLDVHIGSIAIQRFIQEKQPYITLHGHVHESARITGVWKEIIGNTVALSAAHDGQELALMRFNPEEPQNALRELI